MTPARRLSGEELLRPFHLSALQIHAVKEVVQLYFVWQLYVALVQALHDLLDRQSLFFQFRGVLVAVLRTFLWLLRFAFGRDGGDVNFVARHDGRRPAAP